MWCRWGIVLTVACTAVVSCELAIASPIVDYQPQEVRLVLRGLGYDIPATGDRLTDEATRQAIRTLQKRYKLRVDGVVGDRTRDLLATLVKNLQGSLNLVVKPDPPLPGNQYFGPQTKAAVQAFQKQFKLPVTGIANIEIRARLDQEAKRVLGKVPSVSPSPTASPTEAPSPSPTPTDSPARLLSPTPITPSPTQEE
ncbi:peptidoglycan-binding domain-containing protein [Aliterella atlantica]|uniref:Peptidoglycan binding-like domain-containing protein n=1 Tax=Aliterella atlantica CENA595 TaxID=1618023 RepID=A0A0D8ZVB6_9CYAN|nr:peptidoglycan-binding protein [Aliterella atlantica]KJH72414.1 hypothetical protein UH38_06460 [Aliterella atlantica CENA595]